MRTIMQQVPDSYTARLHDVTGRGWNGIIMIPKCIMLI